MNARSVARGVAVLAATLLIAPAEAALKPLVVTNLATPEGNGKFLIFSVSNATAPVLNNAGQVAFWASLSATSGGTFDDTGIYLYDGTALKNIVREGAAAPGGANYDVLSDVPSLNDAGIVAFNSSLRNAINGIDNVGTYLNTGSALVKIARRGEGIPDGNDQFGDSLNTTVNNIGHLRLKTHLVNTPLGNDNLGIYLHNGAGLVKLVRTSEAAPEGNGQFDDFPSFLQGYNDSDQVAFHATLRNTSDGFNDNTGIYLHNGASLVNIVRAGANAPEGNGQFLNISSSAQLNSTGQVAFHALLRNSSGGQIDNSGVYLHNGAALVKIARENENIPDGPGRFDGFGFPVVNDAGQSAFFGYLRSTSNGNLNDSGIYLHNGSALVSYVRENDNVPEGNGRHDAFNRIHLNNTGQVAFASFLRGTSGDLTDNIGIYVTDGIETVKVARKGDTVVGAVIAFLDTTGGYAGDLGLRKSFNDFGQVVFRAAAANGSQGIFLFTPDLRWRSTTSGSWDTAANWTLSLKPGAPHSVSINPTTSLTVTGPTSNVTVSSLTVGNGAAAGQATLNLQTGSVVAATAAITLQDDATIGFEIGGTATADFARLATAGMATLDGQLAVHFVDGFLPSIWDAFTILTASGGVTGTFDTTAAQLPALAGGRKWQINYGANNVALAVVPSLVGDFDNSGAVDATDLTIWRAGFGTTGSATHMQGDADGDRDVDGADFIIWQRQLGSTMVAPTTTNIPEPAAAFMALLAAMCLAHRSKRRRGDLPGDILLYELK